MKITIDTCSLLSLVRYYLPFDNNSVLFNFIKDKIKQGEIIIIDKVLTECSYNSKGIVIEKLSFLEDKNFCKLAKIPHKTDTLIAPAPNKFLRQVDNQFVNVILKKKLNDSEYDSQKNQFLETADMKLIILCLNLIKENDKDIFLVTEESETNNDNKLFKKIPSICKELNIPTITLPELLKKYPEINVEFKLKTLS